MNVAIGECSFRMLTYHFLREIPFHRVFLYHLPLAVSLQALPKCRDPSSVS